MLTSRLLAGFLFTLAAAIAQSDSAQANEIFGNDLYFGAASANVRQVRTLIRDKQFDKAMKLVDTLERRQPDNPTTFNLKGAVYLARNDYANARKSFERALALDPSSTAAKAVLEKIDAGKIRPDPLRPA